MNKATASVRVEAPLRYDPKSVKVIVRAAIQHYDSKWPVKLVLRVRPRQRRVTVAVAGGHVVFVNCPKSGIDVVVLCQCVRWAVRRINGIPQEPADFSRAFAAGAWIEGLTLEELPEVLPQAITKTEKLIATVEKRYAQAKVQLARMEQRQAELERKLVLTGKRLRKARERVTYYEKSPRVQDAALLKRLKDKTTNLER